MSVDGIQIWVEGVAEAIPEVAAVSAIASMRILEIRFIVYSFVSLVKSRCKAEMGAGDRNVADGFPRLTALSISITT
ncbi:hypothetical protein GMST_24460 [Geomonas silvestris]|uniref:Uncharacterized protein n=1 Tax=Geomonas silvestris TaxID=2740184 RepID=A0A6V8MJF6_9BACT|nr:hypothetical protein GMST_24460 [Geomonas silvestris]